MLPDDFKTSPGLERDDVPFLGGPSSLSRESSRSSQPSISSQSSNGLHGLTMEQMQQGLVHLIKVRAKLRFLSHPPACWGHFYQPQLKQFVFSRGLFSNVLRFLDSLVHIYMYPHDKVLESYAAVHWC